MAARRRAERAARETQVAEHERIAEAVVIAAAASDRDEVSGCGQRVMADQFALFRRRLEQLRRVGFRSIAAVVPLMPPRLGPGRPADAGERVDESAALDAEGATDRRLGGATVECGDHRTEFLPRRWRQDGRHDGHDGAPQRGPPERAPWISARSNCANAPKMWNNSSPCGVVVSICSVNAAGTRRRAP